VTLTGGAIGLYSGGSFSTTISSTQIQMLYGSNVASTLSTLGLCIQNGNYFTFVASTGMLLGYAGTLSVPPTLAQMQATTQYVLIGNPGGGFEVDIVNGNYSLKAQASGITIAYAGGGSLVLGSGGWTWYSMSGDTSHPYVNLANGGLTLSGAASGLQLLLTSNSLGMTNSTYPYANLSISINSSGGYLQFSGTAGDAQIYTNGGTGVLMLGPASSPGILTLTGALAGSNLTMGNYSYVALGYSGYISVNGTKVLGAQQTGLGNPTGWSDSTALAWAQSLYAKISAQGLIT
jgi:hypothetical protein